MQKNAQKLVSQRNIFLFLSSALLLLVFLLTILLFSKNERTVIIPTVGPSFWVEEGRVSNTYLEQMGMFLADMLLNRSPADVDKKNQTILEYVHPAFYHEIRKQLVQERENIVKDDQSFLFRAERHYVDAAKGSFVIEGEFLVFVGKVGEIPACAQQERKKYNLFFECLNGKLLLKSLKKGEV